MLEVNGDSYLKTEVVNIASQHLLFMVIFMITYGENLETKNEKKNSDGRQTSTVGSQTF